MMRKNLLAATALAALLSGAALAQDAGSGAGTSSGSTSGTGTATQPVLPNTTTDPAAGASTAQGTDPAATTGSGTTGGMSNESTMAQTDIGAMSADDLIGTDIVDQQGNSIGEVSDIMLGQDGKRVERILVDVGGFLGIGSRTVGIDPNQLQMSQGDGGELVTSMTREQIEGLQTYEKQGDAWGLSTGTTGGTTGGSTAQ